MACTRFEKYKSQALDAIKLKIFLAFIESLLKRLCCESIGMIYYKLFSRSQESKCFLDRASIRSDLSTYELGCPIPVPPNHPQLALSNRSSVGKI